MKNSTLLIFKLPFQTIASFSSRLPSPTALEQFKKKSGSQNPVGSLCAPCNALWQSLASVNTTLPGSKTRSWTACFRSSCSLTVSCPIYLGPELFLISGTLQHETISQDFEGKSARQQQKQHMSPQMCGLRSNLSEFSEEGMINLCYKEKNKNQRQKWELMVRP